MVNYYNIHEGNLHPGDIAKSSDINQIQRNIQDALKNAISDLTEGESWILGTNDQKDKNAFILTPDVKRNGRYIDQMNLAEGNDVEVLSFRELSYRQPIRLSRSSIYSIIVKLQNKSEKSVPVVFELRDSDGNLIPQMRTILELPKETDPTEFEVVFDLDYYPTAFGISSSDLEDGNTQLAAPISDENSFETTPEFDKDDSVQSFSNGASTIYLYIEALNKNKLKTLDINTTQDDGYVWNDVDPTFGIVINKNSTYGQGLEESSGVEFSPSSIRGDLYFKEIYANSPTYKCEPGQAIIQGEKVTLADTHISVGGANDVGDVISYIYMDIDGHLGFVNSDPFTNKETIDPIDYTAPHLHIANIITYMNDAKSPVIYQTDETREYRHRSHHERIRRLEKKLEYTQDIAIPPRFKYTITGEDWIDPDPYTDLSLKSYYGLAAKSIDALDKTGYVVTTNSKGQYVIKLSESESFSVPITLKNQNSGKIITDEKKTQLISSGQPTSYINTLAINDTSRAQIFAEMKNMTNDVSNGKLTLSSTISEVNSGKVSTTDKEAKETKFYPWDDVAENRPQSANVKPITREYTVENGKNGANDWASEFPAMTFFTDTGYTLKKLEIPIYKFKNCSDVKFIIWKRQGPNDQTNTVHLEKRLYTGKFSLKNAKVKKGFQYMEKGFTIDFGEGLSLAKGQYVIICLPVPKSEKGSVYVDTYKPKNSKDFCIRYYGAGNASHFQLKERYQEIWYNSAGALKEDNVYATTGSVTSGTVTWRNKEAIKTVKPSANLTIPDGTSATIFVDVGGGWKEVKNNKSTNITGSGTGESFRWKIEFKGNGKTSPTLAYDKEKKYAINFDITRKAPNTTSGKEDDLDKNLCITSKVFDANRILTAYVGDLNLATSNNKFSNYEFVRIWGEDEEEDLLIDISASDTSKPVLESDGSGGFTNVLDPGTGEELYYPVYSYHYVDLKLSDFAHTSVDYSNYDPFLEEDEHNLRFKLDTENSYSDNDIEFMNYRAFEASDESFINSLVEDRTSIDLTKISESDVNQVIAKAQFDTPIDLSQFFSLQAKLSFGGTVGGTISGLALYISSQNEIDVPTTKSYEDILKIDALTDGLPDLNSSQEEVIATYANKVVRKEYNNDGVGYDVFYQSIWNSKTGEWEWQQLHSVNSFNIYKLSNRSSNTTTITLTENNINSEISFEIKVDPDSVNFQYVREIGLILLNDTEEYSRENVNTVTINNIIATEKGFRNIFTAQNNHVFQRMNSNQTSYVSCLRSGRLNIQGLYPGISHDYKTTNPRTSSITIKHQDVSNNGEDLCYFNVSGSTEGFNHIALRMAADCLIVKHMLELHLRKTNPITGEEKTIEKIILPTLNFMYYPSDSLNLINVSQIIKKIDTDEEFDKIVLHATDKFKNYMSQLKEGVETNENLKNKLTLYIQAIKLYNANTIPLFHPMMRMKFYFDDASSISREKIEIRKIGAILDYL